MSFSPQDVEANREYFSAKLRAEKQKKDVAEWAQGKGHGDFLLLDVRPREAFAKGHVKGATCAPFEELAQLESRIPGGRELVLYCWTDT